MFNFRTLAVIKRELKERIMSKSFIFMTLLFPILMVGFFFVQTFLMTYEGNTNSNVTLVTFDQNITNRLQEVLNEYQFVKDSTFVFDYKTMDQESFNSYVENNKKEVIDEKVAGIVFIPKTALDDKEVVYYSKNSKNLSFAEMIDGPINKVLVESYFQNKDLSQDDLSYARSGVDIKTLRVSSDEKIEEQGYGNLVLSYLFTFLLYLSLIMMGQQVMQAVMEEKSNRIVEVLLSSVSSRELMTGKIIGSAITGALQMSIWLSPIILVVFTAIFSLPPELKFDISIGQFVYLIINFFLGLITFLSLFAMVGSIFENAQEAQSGMWPIMMLIIFPFFISISMMNNPASPIGEIASFFPFANIIVMPAKMTLTEIPIWQYFASLGVSIITLFGLFPFAGKIYNVGILRTGKKPTWGEVIKWLKYN